MSMLNLKCLAGNVSLQNYANHTPLFALKSNLHISKFHGKQPDPKWGKKNSTASHCTYLPDQKKNAFAM